MSQLISVLFVPRPEAPRGAVFAATVYRALARLFGSRHLSAAERRGREAAAVRELADRVRATDPGFASDLDAAADRYLG